MGLYLFDEQPIFANKTLAREIGLNEAVVLQQVNYWVEINKKSGKNYFMKKYWSYNSIKAWHKEFDFMSETTVKRTFAKLESEGYLLAGDFNTDKRNKTKWYTVNEEKLKELYDRLKREEKEREVKEGISFEENEEEFRPGVQGSVTEFSQDEDFEEKVSGEENAEEENAEEEFETSRDRSALIQENEGRISETSEEVSGDIPTIIRKGNIEKMAEIRINTGKEQIAGEVNNALGQNDQMHQVKMTQSIRSKWLNALGQNDPINITENTTENIAENNIYIPPSLPSSLKTEKKDGGMEEILEKLREQGGYYAYLGYGKRKKAAEIDAVARILADFVEDALIDPSGTVRINCTRISKTTVKERIEKMTHSHFEYLVAAVKESTHKINNMRAFVLTVAYNSSPE